MPEVLRSPMGGAKMRMHNLGTSGLSTLSRNHRSERAFGPHAGSAARPRPLYIGWRLAGSEGYPPARL